MKKINIAALYLILIREGTPEQKSANDVETGKQSSARQGLDSNFEGESSLGWLMPSSRPGEFWNSITCLAYQTSRLVGESKKDS